jgi:hypothetical protein
MCGYSEFITLMIPSFKEELRLLYIQDFFLRALRYMARDHH